MLMIIISSVITAIVGSFYFAAVLSKVDICKSIEDSAIGTTQYLPCMHESDTVALDELYLWAVRESRG